MKSVILLSHGSLSATSQAEVADLAEKIKRASDFAYVQYAYLGSAKPHFAEVVQQLVSLGATEIIVLLHFLNSGNHVTEDVPRLLEESRKKYPAIRFQATDPVGLHPAVSSLCLDLINNAKPFKGDSHG